MKQANINLRPRSGITPHADGSPFKYVDYTLPAITIERPEGPLHIMNSIEIAQALDIHFPTPPAHVSSELTQQVEALMLQITIKLSPALIPSIPNVLNPVSAEYYSRERAKLLGISLPELKALMGEKAWEDSKDVLNEFVGLLRRDGNGPFMLGDRVSHADFCLAACFAASERIDAEVFERLLAFDVSFQKLYDGCKEWMVRDSW